MAQVMKVLEVSEYLRVNRTTIYRLLKKGQIPAFKMGSNWRFNSESINRWLSTIESKQTIKDRLIAYCVAAEDGSTFERR